MKILEHGNVTNSGMDYLREYTAVCPECGHEFEIERRVYRETSLFGAYGFRVGYEVDCPECSCRFSDSEFIKDAVNGRKRDFVKFLAAFSGFSIGIVLALMLIVCIIEAIFSLDTGMLHDAFLVWFVISLVCLIVCLIIRWDEWTDD